MPTEKITNFFFSQDYDKMVEDLANFLGFKWGDVNTPRLLAFINDLLKTNKKGDELRESVKNWLNFLDEEKRNQFLDYLEKNYRAKIDELWQEETQKEQPEIEEAKESYEERERRYLELMKEILKLETKKEKKEETETEEIKKKVITLEPEEVKKKEIPVTWEPPKEEEPVLPEGTIIIQKKVEERKPTKGEDFLDLSNL